MLQRAATNAYSWWWASHIRTKQSKWLDQNLHDMEEKVEYILKIINEDGDSFRTRAEQYYRKRPEILNFVEDCFRGYRALAERYDHLSRDLQSANRTIATVFPERVQMSIDEDDYEDFTVYSNENIDHKSSSPLPLPQAPEPKNFPKLQTVAHAVLKTKTNMPTRMMSKKGLIKMGVDENASGVSKSSGLSKDEALEEINKLQKGILGLQMEKEFLKSSYDNALSKYWEIENKITEMQSRVSSLQDEIGVGTVIEDNDAKTLMSSTALKTCQEMLAKLQNKQKRYKEDATVEHRRVDDAIKTFESIIKCNHNNDSNSLNSKVEQTVEDFEEITAKIHKENWEEMIQERFLASQDEKESCNDEDKKAKIKLEEFLGKSGPVTISEVAEKIETLVDKVLSLETEVTSQTALVMRLRLETNELQEHIQNIEEEKEILTDDSNNMKNMIRALEEELERVQSLNQKVKTQNVQLENSFEEANVSLHNLSKNLLIAKPDEDGPNNEVISEEIMERDLKFYEDEEGNSSRSYTGGHDLGEIANEEENKTKLLKENDDSWDALKKDEGQALSENPMNDQEPEVEPNWKLMLSYESRKENRRKWLKQNEDSLGSLMKDDHHALVEKPMNDQESKGDHMDEEDEPNWKLLLSYGLEDREKMLLEEYTSMLRNYKQVKKKLKEIEKKNRASSFKSAVQMKMLRSSNHSKDSQIQSLFEKLKRLETNKNKMSGFEVKKAQDSVNEKQQTMKDEDGDESIKKLPVNEESQTRKEEEEEDEYIKKPPINEERETRKEDDDESIKKLPVNEELQIRSGEEDESMKKLLVNEERQTRKEEDDDEPIKKLRVNEELQTRIEEDDECIKNLPFNEEQLTKEEQEHESIKKLPVNEEQLTRKEEEYDEYIKKLHVNDEPQKRKEEEEEEDEYIKKLPVNDERQTRKEKNDDDKKPHCDESQEDIKDNIHTAIDELLEENLELWLRFSTSYHQIQNLKESYHDLLQEINDIKEKKPESENSKSHHHHQQRSSSFASDIRPIYQHLGDMQTELTLWMQNNGVLRDDLQHRQTSLSDIQEQISNLTSMEEENTTTLSKYEAAKFHGAVLNMKTENMKVSDELKMAAERVKRLRFDIEKTLKKLDEELGKKKKPTSSNSTKVPMRSFMFGIKLKKHRSLFSCMSPSLQRQYSDIELLPPPNK